MSRRGSDRLILMSNSNPTKQQIHAIALDAIRHGDLAMVAVCMTAEHGESIFSELDEPWVGTAVADEIRKRAAMTQTAAIALCGVALADMEASRAFQDKVYA